MMTVANQQANCIDCRLGKQYYQNNYCICFDGCSWLLPAIGQNSFSVVASLLAVRVWLQKTSSSVARNNRATTQFETRDMVFESNQSQKFRDDE